MRSRRISRKSLMKTARLAFQSERGFSLMEIMVTVGVLSIVALGTSVLFSDMFMIQKRANTVASIQAMRDELIGAIVKSDTSSFGPFSSAWAAIVADVSNDDETQVPSVPALGMQCIRDNSPCQKDAFYPLNVRRADTSEIFSSRIATRGFRLDGRICNTYSTSTPDPNCPFRWDITLFYRCVGTNKLRCENPHVEVNGVLRYSPGTNDPLGSSLNLSSYAFTVRRGDKPDMNRPIVISYVVNTGTGEGNCKGDWFTRRLNTVSSEPVGLATIQNSGTTNSAFTLPLGGYDCRVQVPAFKNGQNRIRMVNAALTQIFTSGSSTAALTGGSATVTLQATFVINVSTQFRIQHYCTGQPSDGLFGSSNNNFGMGVPAPDGAGNYTNTTYTVVSCIKTS